MKPGGSKAKPNVSTALPTKDGSKKTRNVRISRKIDTLFKKGLNIISREIDNLSMVSRREKLNLMEGAELRAYVKLLGDVSKQSRELRKTKKEEEAESLQKLTDEEFEKKCKEFLLKPKDKK